MELKVKSNGKTVTMPKDVYENLPSDQKRSYQVLSNEDKVEVAPKDQVAKNEKKPETGDKK